MQHFKLRGALQMLYLLVSMVIAGILPCQLKHQLCLRTVQPAAVALM